MDKTEIRAKAKACVDAVYVWVRGLDDSDPYKKIEAALTAAHTAGVSQAHRIEIFPDGGDVYVHHEKCGGACDYSCDGGGFLPYPEAVDFLVKENE